MPKTPLRILKTGFPGLQFFAYATLSCFNPYIAIILSDRGLDNTRIGLVLTANSLVTIIAQPFWGMVSDRIHSIRKVFIICFASVSLLYLPMPLVRSYPLLLLIFPAIIFFNSPIVPLMDTWTYQAMKDQPGKSYGSVRLWGSVGYAIVLILVSRTVALTSVNVTSIGFILLAIISILISLNLPQEKIEGNLNILAPKKEKLRLGQLLKNYYYVTFVLILGLLNIAVQPMFGFLPRLMLSIGGTPEMYSWLMVLSAIMEVPVFIVARSMLARFRAVPLLLVSMLFFVLRIYLYSVVGSPAAMILISLLHGPPYAVYLTATINYIDELAPAGLKSTALTIASSIYGGFSGMLGNAVAGRMMDVLTIQPVYRIGVWIVVAVLVLFVITLLIGRAIFNSKSARCQSESRL